MKLPSVAQIVQESGRTFRRFPVAILSAIVGTAAGLVIVDHEGPAQPTILFKVLLAAALGIPFLSSLTLIAEKRKWGLPVFLGTLAACLILLVVYALGVPADLPDAPAMHMIRFAILVSALLMFAAFAPFSGRGEINGFWQFNKALLLRIITAAVFASVLYAGLALALAAIDNLFGVEIEPKRYFELWILIAGIFTTWFFLAGVPEDLDALEASTDYPKVIKIFAQYILFPLVLVYLAILYAYIVKILVEWSWPRGWVSGLIFGYGTAGILMLLLLHPIREKAETVWIKSASRWFYLSMIPLVVVLFLAMYRRISEYGLTEARYLGMALAFWLAAMTAYFLLSRGKSIKVIPGSMFVGALLASFGPWGAFQVSESNQVARLREVLEKNLLLADGTVRKADAPVPREDAVRISSILSYLREVHGYDAIQPWFRESLSDDTARTGKRAKAPGEVTKLLGVEYAVARPSGGERFDRLQADGDEVTDLGGYDRMIGAQSVSPVMLSRSFPAEGVAWRVNAALDTFCFISTPPGGGPSDSVTIALRPVVEKLLADYGGRPDGDKVPSGTMVVETSDPGGLKVKLCLSSVSVRWGEERTEIVGWQGDVLYKNGQTP